MRDLLLLLIEACCKEEQDTTDNARWHEIISVKDDLEGQLDQTRVKVIDSGDDEEGEMESEILNNEYCEKVYKI